MEGLTSLKSLRLRDLLTFGYIWLPLVTFPGLTGPYWALLGHNWALLGLNWALLSLTGPYYSLLSLN